MSLDLDQTQLPAGAPKGSLLAAGQLFGQYKVVRLLGRGGMGEVYEVENPVLEKRYALKLLNREIMERPDAAERFKREAKVMARFEHPNIVKVDDFGEIEGHSVLRMELIDGSAVDERGLGIRGLGGRAVTSLADLLTGYPLPEALVVDLLTQILEGIAYAHGQGVVHRDLKPANILLNPNPLNPNPLNPKISDFGLVRLAGEQWIQSQIELTRAHDPDATRLDAHLSSELGTSSQAMMGTFAYMSPEQKKGAEADARSDLYAVGLMAFQMLTGVDTPSLERPSEIIEKLHSDWDALLVSVLHREPEKRPATALVFLDRLKMIPSGCDDHSNPEIGVQGQAALDDRRTQTKRFARPPPGWKGA